MCSVGRNVLLGKISICLELKIPISIELTVTIFISCNGHLNTTETMPLIKLLELSRMPKITYGNWIIYKNFDSSHKNNYEQPTRFSWKWNVRKRSSEVVRWKSMIRW